ncbi:hypothetical protein [Methanobacterium formicicum]|uniref:Uncharacterized protein n=1 Tax=Methanobacterium formicicum (strain DSM 3637 / PP1) TaxID=1204725 RepID=K2R1C9_METFP|nr:hypothetical protein [Methanobacterium formicicum]EKF85032.1 hypothetical protein A994_10454 [Methanobacterium formicicum DSM 3637]
MSLDLLLALIPITIMLGLVAANMGNIMYDTQDTIYRSSLERVSADTVNTLLKTSGDPYNWESNPSQTNVVGVAQYDPVSKNPIEYTLSTKKMAMLKSTIGQTKTQSMLGDQYGFLITLSPVNSTGTIVWNLTSAGTPKENAKDVVKIERDVLYNPFDSDVLTSIKNAGHGTGKPKDYSSNPFSTNQYDLEVYDYYILIFNRGVTSTSVYINQYEVMSENEFKGHDKYSNWTKIIPESYLKNGTNLENNILYLKKVASGPTTDMDAYVIRVPQGTSPSEVTAANALPKSYRFQFYAWTK